MKMCQAFAGDDHEVTLFSPERKNIEKNIDDVYQYYGVKRNFNLRKVTYPSIKGRGYYYGFLVAREACKLNPDLVYCRNLPGCYFSALRGMKVIFEAHSPIIDSGRLSEWFFKKLIKRKELQKLVVITHSLKKYFIDTYDLPPKIIQVAPDGADPVPEGTQPILLSGKGKRLQVGYVGHLYLGKGMEVIHKLAKQCPWADFNIVGGTEQDLVSWNFLCQNITNIIFHGYKPQSQVQQYLVALDIMLLPNQRKVYSFGGGSNISEWTSPLKAFEYMSASKAIIASDLPVIKEIFTDGENALLCNPENIHEWAAALLLLNEDLYLRNKLASNAYNMFITSLSWKQRAINLLNI